MKEEYRVFKHLQHPPIGPIASGVGGAVELDFVRRFRLFPGALMPVYHGTTNFLRIGDASLIHVETFDLAGLAELKAGPVSEGKAAVTLILQGGAHLLPLASGVTAAPTTDLLNSPTAASARLARQLQRADDVLALSPPSEIVPASLTPDYQVLTDLAEEAARRGYAFRRANASVAVAVFKNVPRPSLFHRLSHRSSRNALKSVKKLVPADLYYLATPHRDANALWMANLSLAYVPGAEPLFWSPADRSLVDAIFHGRVTVMTFFNPARFIAELRELGFVATLAPAPERVRLERQVGCHRVEFRGLGLFLHLIQACFVPPEEVARALAASVERIGEHDVKPGQRIDLLPLQQHPDLQ